MRYFGVKRKLADTATTTKGELVQLKPYMDARTPTGVHPAPADEAVVPTIDADVVDDRNTPAEGLAPERDATGVYIENPHPWQTTIERMPVVPPWMRDRGERHAAAAWLARHVGHTVAFHGTRVPKYVVRTVAHSPRGVYRTFAGFTRWTLDSEGAPVRQAASEKADFTPYLQLSRQRKERVRFRLQVTLFAVVVLAGAGVALALLAPGWAQAAAVLLTVTVMGVVGRRLDKPMFDAPVLPSEAERLRDTHVVRALASLGISAINTAVKNEGINFAAPVARDVGGWLAVVDLPYGVTATTIMSRRDDLASGLRRPLGCVWPEPDHEAHAGRLKLYVADKDMAKAKQGLWPLAKTGTADIFAPLPFGTDQRGRLVTLTLMYGNMIIGAMPRYGKSFAVRVLLLGCALDPTVELRVFDLKGMGDLDPLQKVAHEFASGPSDDATLDAALESLRQLAEEEIPRRATVIAKLPRDLAAENKVNPVVSKMRQYRLHPIVVAVDEIQELFITHRAADAERYWLKIIKQGPAAGIMGVLSTQRPDKDSLPKAISAQADKRFCLRVMGHMENDMVLGSGRHTTGIRATMFTTKDRGIGYLIGDLDDPQIVRTFYIDAQMAERIADRARALRVAAGRLTGFAAGDVDKDTRPAHNPLVDMLAVMGPDEKLHSQTICARLKELRPDVYATWDQDILARIVGGYGIETRNMNLMTPDEGRCTRKGVQRDWLEKAIDGTRRDAIA